MALASIIGDKLNAKASQVQSLAGQITDKTPDKTAKFGAASQEFGIKMNATNKAIKSLGEGLSTIARKRRRRKGIDLGRAQCYAAPCFTVSGGDLMGRDSRHMSRLVRAVVVIGFIATGSFGYAQVFDMGVLTNTVSIDHVTQQEAAWAASDQVFGGSADVPDRNPADVLNFRTLPQRTSTNLATFVAKTREPAKADLARLFASQPDLIDEIGGVMQSYGLDPANIADAYALWWMSAWLVANQRQDTPPAATIAAVRDQARNAFAATSGFAEADDAGKQQYAEALMVQATLLNTALEQSANQPKMLAQLAEAAKKGALSSGLDLNTMVLTEQGFVPREGADASSVSPEDAPALASTQADAVSPATYAAAGALATLALGGAFWLGKRSG
ncbi:DUF6683 family protein [Altererythrobacter sp. CAU 1778]